MYRLIRRIVASRCVGFLSAGRFFMDRTSFFLKKSVCGCEKRFIKISKKKN